jgi:hypothetical protein
MVRYRHWMSSKMGWLWSCLAALLSFFGLWIGPSHALTVEISDRLQHGTGSATSSKDVGRVLWNVVPGRHPRGHLVFGPYAREWGAQSLTATFYLQAQTLSNRSRASFTLDIYDATSRRVLATREFEEREVEVAQVIGHSLSVDLPMEEGHEIETRLYWHGRQELTLHRVEATLSDIRLGLPQIVNKSGASDERVRQLVEKAVRDLGFQDALQGPNGNDIIFAGKYYLAWLDQTGFAGKMNGFWILNGDPSQLDFLQLERGRAVNSLIAGENGDGVFHPAYNGSEHYEIPDNTPERWQDRDCTRPGEVCNWYSLPEASPIRRTDLKWWSSCGKASVGWGQLFSPINLQQDGQELEVTYESPIKKMGDNHRTFFGGYHGLRCGGDYRFENGEIHPVYLQLGYRLYGDRPYFDRTYRFRQPEGNPDFGRKIWSVIHGLVITELDRSPVTKQFFRHTKMEDTPARTRNLDFSLPTEWSPYPSRSSSRDDVWAWLNQAYSLSTSSADVYGSALRVSMTGGGYHGDNGFCLCRVHGALELGGGVLGGSTPGATPPILRSGASSEIAIKRVEILGDPGALVDRMSWDANDSEFHHRMGRLEGDGWSTFAGEGKGHLVYGPYFRMLRPGVYTATFQLQVDNNSANNRTLAELEIFDANTDEVIASRSLTRRQFSEPGTSRSFELTFDWHGRLGHALELRVKSLGRSYLKVGNIEIMPLNHQ